MVLDVKAMTWAAQNDIDTAKLKAAKVPIYGKWYFPKIPANVSLVNLETGERGHFTERMIAGEVVWVAEADLRRARLGPYASAPAEEVGGAPSAGPGGATTVPAVPVEPMIAMSRPPMAVREPYAAENLPATVTDEGVPSGVHMPKASIAPFVLGIGLALALLGLITNPFVLAVGIVWSLAGAIAWVRIGLLEAEENRARGH